MEKYPLKSKIFKLGHEMPSNESFPLDDYMNKFIIINSEIMQTVHTHPECTNWQVGFESQSLEDDYGDEYNITKIYLSATREMNESEKKEFNDKQKFLEECEEVFKKTKRKMKRQEAKQRANIKQAVLNNNGAKND